MSSRRTHQDRTTAAAMPTRMAIVAPKLRFWLTFQILL
jgi:hypothetical protein